MNNDKPENISYADWQILLQQKKDLKEIKNYLEKNYPIQYLIGNVEFCDCLIEVNENCLIPRFETEELVEKTFQKIKQKKYKNPQILEIGTGSGCISIALKKKLKCKIKAIDINEKALKLAQKNALINQVEITFEHIDVEKLKDWKCDILISNPPYVSYEEPVGKETKYEPPEAIFATNKGLYFYDVIIKKISELREKPTLIAFEIGMNQTQEIKKLQQMYLPNYKFNAEKDLSGKDRFVFIEL